MSALEKVVQFAEGSQVSLSAGMSEDPDVGELIAAAGLAVSRLTLLLAGSDDDEDDDDDDQGSGNGKNGSAGGSHSSHATYKKLVAKGMDPKLAAKMCAKADNKVEATALANSAAVLLSGLPQWGLIALAAPEGESASDRRSLAAKGWALADGSYPMGDAKHVHSAAVLAASKHGDYKAAKRLIRKMAKIHGVPLESLPGFGKEKDDEDEKVAASVMAELSALTGLPADHAIEFLELAKAAAVPLQAFHHGSWSGTHDHGHLTMEVHSHAHSHNGDSMHDRHSHGGHGYSGQEMMRDY